MSHNLGFSIKITERETGKIHTYTTSGASSSVELDGNTYPFRSFTDNIMKFLYVMMSGEVDGTTKAISTDGEEVSVRYTSEGDGMELDAYNTSYGTDLTIGGVVGTVNTSVTKDDYKLGTILTDADISVLDGAHVSPSYSNTASSFKMESKFTNASGGPLTVRESGIYVNCIDGAVSKRVMIARDVYEDKPVEDAKKFKLRYNFEMGAIPTMGFSKNFTNLMHAALLGENFQLVDWEGDEYEMKPFSCTSESPSYSDPTDVRSYGVMACGGTEILSYNDIGSGDFYDDIFPTLSTMNYYYKGVTLTDDNQILISSTLQTLAPVTLNKAFLSSGYGGNGSILAYINLPTEITLTPGGMVDFEMSINTGW